MDKVDLRGKIYYQIERYEKRKKEGDDIFKKEGEKECRIMLVDIILGLVGLYYQKK